MKREETLTSTQTSLLLKEASLTSTSIGHGLTLLRKADISHKGNYYQSFFQLTTGLERLLKLIIISKYRGTYNRLPNNKVLKQYGHKIFELFDTVSKYSSANNRNPKLNDICLEILKFLTEFAMSTRYYNLDVLTNRNINTIDPLIHWSNIQIIIRNKHKRRVGKEKQKLTNSLNKIINEKSIVYVYNENNKLIESFSELSNYMDDQDFVQGYAILYLLEILEHLIDILTEIEEEYDLFPYLREFFNYYTIGKWLKTYEIRRRRNWIYP